jgi:hypothetical protein
MNKGIKMLAIGILLVNLLHAQTPKPSATNKIILTNTSSIALTDKPVIVKRAQLPAVPTGTVYPLIMSSKGDTIAAQLDDLNGDNKWDELFFVVNLPANVTQALSLKWVTTQPQFVKRTSIRFGKRMSANEHVQPATSEVVLAADMPKKMGFQRYQTDGPSWENDKVGFRHYLDGRNAKDVFGKKVAYMSPETVGINANGAVEDNYHVMEAWGRDVMAVGNSVGIGGVAMLKHDSIMRLGITVDDSINNVEKTNFRIITEGPVRSMMNIKYNNWKPDNTSYNVEETTSIWPGMYAYHNSVNISGTKANENLLIGIVSIFATKPPVEVKVNDKWVALLSHDKHSYNQEWWLPLALIVPVDSYLGLTEAPKKGKLSNSYLAKMKITGKPVEYYSVACWEISDEGFKDPAYFQKYVQNLTKQISAEVKVVVK